MPTSLGRFSALLGTTSSSSSCLGSTLGTGKAPERELHNSTKRAVCGSRAPQRGHPTTSSSPTKPPDTSLAKVTAQQSTSALLKGDDLPCDGLRPRPVQGQAQENLPGCEQQQPLDLRADSHIPKGTGISTLPLSPCQVIRFGCRRSVP